MRPSLALLASLATSFLALGAVPAPGATLATPNIVLLLLDDAGYGDFGLAKASFATTPEIDALAASGLSFTQFYANAPVCSPTRASILTGRYPQAFGFRRAVPPPSTRGLPTDVTSIPQVLAPLGYESGFFGKWHLGDQQPQHRPNAHGFDESVFYLQDPAGVSYIDPTLVIDDTTEVPTVGHMTEIITDYALAFVDAHETDTFFLMVSYLTPHAPLEPPPGWQQKWPYKNNQNGRYAALMSNVDEQIARIIARLDSLGISPVTLVMLTSDNGSVRDGMGANGGLSGIKAEMLEGGIRVPMIWRWPGTLAPGSTDAVGLGYDLLPTLAGYLETDVSGLGLPGEDLSSLLGGAEPAARQSLLFWEIKDSRTRIFPLTQDEFNRYAVRDGPWKIVQQDNEVNASPFLYDVVNDPKEQIDLAALHPDIVSRLQREYRVWRAETTRFPLVVDTVHPGASVAGDVFTFTGGYVELADDSRYNIDDGDFTFQSLVETTDLSQPDPQVLAEKPGVWSLFLDDYDRIRLDVEVGDGSAKTLLGPVLHEGLVWDVAFTVFGWRESYAILRLYVNGVLRALDESIPALPFSASPITLGAAAGGASPFHGILTDPKVYTAGLTEMEIADQDDDGLHDAVDNCPLDANPSQIDTDADAMGNDCDDDDDGDGFLDVVETNTGVFLSDLDTGTDPLNADTDGDGASDFEEFVPATDPNDWLSRPTDYTQRSAFLSRLLGRSGFTDFDSIAASTLLSGNVVQVSGMNSVNIEFPTVDDVIGAPLAELDLMVVPDLGENPTLSSPHSLGTDDTANYDTISAGTEIQFTFPTPAQGFGLSFISNDQRFTSLQDGDVELLVPGVATAVLRLSHGSYLGTYDGVAYYSYFLGVMETGNQFFTEATLSYGPGVDDSAFLFNIDDLISVPEPDTVVGLVIGCLALAWASRHRPDPSRRQIGPE